MSRTIAPVPSAALLTAVLLTVAGCGSSGSSASTPTGGGTTTPAAAGAPASSAGGAGGEGSSTSCSHGLQPSVNGVVDVECGGPATIHITAGSVSESITGGTCRRVDTTWTVTAGVITQ